MPRQSKGEIFDLSNLEDAKRLVQQISDILNKPHTSAEKTMADNEKLVILYKKLMEISSKVKDIEEIGIHARNEKFRASVRQMEKDIQLQEKYIKNEASKQVAIEKTKNAMQEQIKLQQDLEKEIDDTASKLQEYSKQWQPNQKSFSLNNVGNTLLDKKIQQAQKGNQQQIEDITNGILDKHRLAGTLTKDNMSNIQNEINDTLGKEFKDGTTKLNIAAGVLNAAGQAIKDGIGRVWTLFKSGIEKQTDLYESTFENISVRTGISAERYRQQQRATVRDLSSQGLYDNVAVSEVQEMWQNLANTGMNESDMFATAIDNVVTQKIVPYLDTTSRTFNILNNRLDGKFVKDIRGINAANLEIAGSNYVTEDLLNDLMELVKPMSDEAINNLAQSSTEVTTMANKLINDYGWTESDAMEYAKTAFKYQNYGAQVFSQGSVSDKFGYINILRSGLDINDLNNANNIAGIKIDSDNFLLDSVGANYNSTMGAFTTNTGAYAMGINASTARNLVGKRVNGSSLASATDNIDLSGYSEQALADYVNGENQTSKQKQDIMIENAATDIATIKEYMGEWSVVVESLLGGIKSILGVYIGSKLFDGLGKMILGDSPGGVAKGLAGILTSEAGFGSVTAALSTTGAIAGAVVAGTVITDAILNKVTDIDNARREEIQTAAEEAGELNKEESFGNAAVQTAFEAAEREQNTGGVGATIANGFRRTGLFATGYLGWGNSYAARKKKAEENGSWKEYNIAAGLYAGLDDSSNEADASTRLGLEIAYGLALDEVGMLQGTGIMKEVFGDNINSRQDLYDLMAKYYKEYNVGAQSVLGYSSLLASEVKPKDSHGNDWDGTLSDILSKYSGSKGSSDESTNNFKEFMKHRQGLNSVPYDNYPALLHEGEAVLTASTANEMRTLVDEYRDNNQQNANFDVIIQGQTEALLTKMDEIIGAMNGTTVNNIQNNNLGNSDNITKTNMLRLRSTKSWAR